MNPKSVVKILAADTIEERIRNFQPKVYGKTLQGVHSLLIDVPFENPVAKDRRRPTAPPWQHSLCTEAELKNVEKLEKYLREDEVEVTDAEELEYSVESPNISDIEGIVL